MKTIPLSIGTIHFVGIGGIGMSGIAEILHNLGYQVQGSDVAESANVKRLRGLGITVAHRPCRRESRQCRRGRGVLGGQGRQSRSGRRARPPGAGGAPRRDAGRADAPQMRRSPSAGTHGKTTTTSMIAALLDAAGLDPDRDQRRHHQRLWHQRPAGRGRMDGGRGRRVRRHLRQAARHRRRGHQYRSRASGLLRHASTSCATASAVFVENIPFYGFAALCIDHPEVQALIPRVPDRKIVTYGFSPQADVRAVEVDARPGRRALRRRHHRPRAARLRCTIADVHLPMYGQHNVQNSLAAVAVGQQLGFERRRHAPGALAGSRASSAASPSTGEAAGITVIDDYGHHPVEIAAVLRAARSATAGQVIAVVQPHRYTRLANLFEEFCTCFNDADAGDRGRCLCRRRSADRGSQPRRPGRGPASARPSPCHAAARSGGAARNSYRHRRKPGDLVVCLGAGNITAWANALPRQLEALAAGKPVPPGGRRVTAMASPSA